MPKEAPLGKWIHTIERSLQNFDFEDIVCFVVCRLALFTANKGGPLSVSLKSISLNHKNEAQDKKMENQQKKH